LKDAGKFDDVVFHCIRDGQLCTRLLQAKHSIGNKTEITVEDLLDRSANSKFGLKMYFECYKQIRGNFKGELELILCTNIGLKFGQNCNITKLLRGKKTSLQQHGPLYFEPITTDDDIFGELGEEVSRFRLASGRYANERGDMVNKLMAHLGAS